MSAKCIYLVYLYSKGTPLLNTDNDDDVHNDCDELLSRND